MTYIPDVLRERRESEAITITKKDWHLLKLFMRHVTWGKVDQSEAWKNFVDSVESRFDESKQVAETSQSYYEKKLREEE